MEIQLTDKPKPNIMLVLRKQLMLCDEAKQFLPSVFQLTTSHRLAKWGSRVSGRGG
jgi:hypothetical protein